MSGNGNDGTVYGATMTTDRFGNMNSAYEFDGTSDYIDLQNGYDFEERSISLWTNVYALPSNDLHIYISDDPSLSHGFTQILTNVVAGDTVLKSSACIAGGIAQSIISTNTWHMITITVCADSVRHYFDGQFVGSTEIGTTTSSSGNQTALLGTSRLFDRYFSGKIDDVRVYNRCISTEEVLDLYVEEPLSVLDINYTEGDLIVYPNPTSTHLTIQLSNSGQRKYDLFLYNSENALVQTVYNVTSMRLEMDVHHLASGLYFLLLKSNGEVTSINKVQID
jgi:hypothetical protein